MGEAGILGEDVEPEAWVIDLNAGRLEIHRAPAAAGYRDVRGLTRDDGVAPLAFPAVAITPADVLG